MNSNFISPTNCINNKTERRNSHGSSSQRATANQKDDAEFSAKEADEQKKKPTSTTSSVKFENSTKSVSLKLRSASASNEPSTSVHSSPPSLSATTAVQTHSSSNSTTSAINEADSHNESLKQSTEINILSTKTAVSATNVMPNLNIIASSESPSSPTTTLNNSVQAEPIQKNQLTDSNAKVLSSSSPSSSSTVITTKIDVPEKKRKSVSSSRQKKFHRHFQQVSSDEPVLNYFSCALVSDILLQGYLYITENYFAFYSNVFGYVTKLLIPVTSVTKISKEKTVKIFPNAIAVGTVDERHVFSSFLSRETAYQLMISIWQDAVIHRQFQSSAATNNIATASNLLQIACATINGTSSSASTDTLAQRVENDENGEAADVTITTTRIENTVGTNSPKYCRQNNDGLLEISELEDDSSSAISGSESLTKRLLAQTLAQQHPLTQTQQEDVQNPTIHDDWNSSFARQSATLPLPNFQWVCAVLARWYSNICKWQSKIPQTVPAIYFGLSLIIILSLMALLLFCRIHELRSPKIPTFSVENIDENSPFNLEMYSDLLKWQENMQSEKIKLTQNVLNANLDQISKISDNLEKLYKLIGIDTDVERASVISSILGECDTNDSNTANDICS